jgi:uncharacterized coiled-coil protein SlyX
MDYYATIIRQRTDAEAVALLADECRKKDAAIDALKKRVAALELALGLTADALTAIAERIAEVKQPSEEMEAFLNLLRPVIRLAGKTLKREVAT